MFTFTVTHGPDQGKNFTLRPGQSATVGTGEGDSVRLADPKVLAGHCALEAKPAYVLLRNQTATAGTFLGEKKIAQAELRANANFRIGDTVLTLRVAAAQPAAAAPPDPLIGRIIGGYKLNEVVGKGGMGTVYRATQLSLHRDVALKVLAPALAKDKNFVDLFINEARAAAQLAHPNIVQVYDAGTEGDTSFFSMEYIGQGSVEEVLEREKKISWERAILMVLEAAHGLDYAEGKRIVHRDIKPDNLMLNEDGRIKIADLGLAKRGEGTKDEGVIGTPHFIPPEQALGKDVDTRADIYSLGATFFRMVTGRTLYSGKTAKEIVLKHIKEPPPAASSVEKSAPDDLDLVLARMLAKDPNGRYQTAKELIAALEEVCAHHGIKGSIIKKGVGKRVLVPLILLILAGGGVIYKLANKPPPPPDPALIAAQQQAEERERLAKERAQKLEQEGRRKDAESAWTNLDNEYFRINTNNPIDSVYDDQKSAAELAREWNDYIGRLGTFAESEQALEFDAELQLAVKANEKKGKLTKRLKNNEIAATDKREWIKQQITAAKELDKMARLALAEFLRERRYEMAANYCDRLTKEPRPKDDPFAPVESAEWQSPVDKESRHSAAKVKEIADLFAKARQYFADEGKIVVNKAQGDWEAVKGTLPASPESASDEAIEEAIASLEVVAEKFTEGNTLAVKEIRDITAEAKRKSTDLARLLDVRFQARLASDREAIRRRIRELRSLDPGKTPNHVMNLEINRAISEWQRVLQDGEVKSPRYRAFVEERMRMLRWMEYLFATFQRDVRITEATRENTPLRSLECEGIFEPGGRPFSFRFDKPTENPYEFRLSKKYQGSQDVWHFGVMTMDWVHTHAFHVPGKDGAAGELRWVEATPVLRFALGAFCYETMQYRAAAQHFEVLLEDATYGAAATYLLGRSKLEAAARQEYEQLLAAGLAAETSKQVGDVLGALKNFGQRHQGTLFGIEVMRSRDVVDVDFFPAEELPAIPKTPPTPPQ